MSEIYRITDKLLILKDGKQIYSGDTIGVGDGICKLEISSSDDDIDKEYFSDLEQAIDFIESYKKNKEIKSLKVDYPAFEEGVIKYVK
jgi:ABC-type multidrug transport system ATPase subunit